MNKRKLVEQCEATLKQNDLGNWTRPAPGLYPHQWLWDSCFIGIGLRHIDVKRAQSEIDSLFRGQWKNGMIPHIIRGPGDYYADNLWERGLTGEMPEDTSTSGITQPPLIAEAMVRIGEKMSKKDREQWYRHHFNQLLAHHEWLYRERDPHSSGLIALVHPWESGIDNSPSWMSVLHRAHKPLWVSIASNLGFKKFLEKMRKDTRYVPASERLDTIDGILIYFQARQLRRMNYDTSKILKRSHITINDVLFNSIAIRNNTLLIQIADQIGAEVPNWLLDRMKRANDAIEALWDETTHSYYDQHYKTSKLIKKQSIGRYLPLYSDAISKDRAKLLASQIEKELDEMLYPIPTVPLSSPYFNHHRYWQGPMWVNTNWLICDGLERYGYTKLAKQIRHRTLMLVEQYGPHEYFSPIDGTPAGAHQFSWTAALALDMVHSSE